MSMRECLEKLVKGSDLSEREARGVMEVIASGKADPAQTGAFLALLAAKGETAGEITAIAKVMREQSIKVEIPDKVLDVVGTGGDGHNTVNISTSAAIVASSLGAKVAKHGNRSVSSKSGSSDVLQKLGIALLGPNEIAECVADAGISFMFAPNFHPAMKHVIPIRQALQIRTIFNIMGPLLNPAGARRLMLGVYTPTLIDTYAQVVYNIGVDHALIVHCQGLDELAAVGVAEAAEITKDGIKRIKIDPQEFGIPKCTIKDLEGGEAEENAEIIRNLFKGGEAANGPIAHTIALNAGAALYVYGSAKSIEEGYKMSIAQIQSGRVTAQLDKFATISTALASRGPLS
eukprot:CAMPEP_0203759880 /NCGR_PEP_ID=MMETSP0098-20131031/13195_1 /ASSEMBLY_ACC=CAM_ASM_000208 /TAXON_ID=96639 /ORGANISM=" , Strain NY0313808BC1" /LENGTH=345 /DNA_ID=CAMNT_0050653179 /DNA_START=27 /DNA_END=1064 /DNA_ORIENTATION=+